MTILPFLGSSRKKRQMMAQEVKEFSELVKDQYTFWCSSWRKCWRIISTLVRKWKRCTRRFSRWEDSWRKLRLCSVAARNVCNEYRWSLKRRDEFMRTINLIVIHCSATRADRDFTEDDLEVCHRRRGFNGTGYHFISVKWRYKDHPWDWTNRCARKRTQPEQYWHLLWGRTWLPRSSRRYPYRMASSFNARTDSYALAWLSRLPGVRTSGFEPRSEWKRRDWTRRMD